MASCTEDFGFFTIGLLFVEGKIHCRAQSQVGYVDHSTGLKGEWPEKSTRG